MNVGKVGFCEGTFDPFDPGFIGLSADGLYLVRRLTEDQMTDGERSVL